MKKIYLIILTTILALLKSNSYAVEFVDIANHWAKTEIEESITNDIINGYSDNKFKPNEGVTLAEYLKIIIKSAKFDLIKEGSYWPDYFIATAKQKGLILEDEFKDYNKKLTRNEIARITGRYIRIEDIKKSKNKLKDLDEEYKDEIQKLINLNVIKGYEDKTYRGENNVTRAEAIIIAKRATEERRKLVSQRKYKDEEKINLTNLKISDNDEGAGPVSALKYKIKNNKIYIYDSGRYSNLQGYEIKDEKINITKTIKVINNLIDEDSYTEVLYVPSHEILNQLIVKCAENKNVIDMGGFDFEFAYYENKTYELKRISKVDVFSNNCYIKIEIGKLWRDFYKFTNKEYVDKYKKEKFKKCIEIEFGINYSDEILEYMLNKYEKKISGQTRGIEEKEQKVFGKYIVNYYKKADGNPTFYIEK